MRHEATGNSKKVQFLGLTLSALLFALSITAEAQQLGKIVRIGYLTTQPTALDSGRRQEIREALRKVGYVEGQNLSIEYRSAEGKIDRNPALAAELVDIIITTGPAPTRAATRATVTIPIVMPEVGDPVGSGLSPASRDPTGTSNLLRECESARRAPAPTHGRSKAAAKTSAGIHRRELGVRYERNPTLLPFRS